MTTDISQLPPGLVLLTTKLVDLVIGTQWRSLVPFGLADPPGWLSYKVPTVTDTWTAFPTYADHLSTTGETASIQSAFAYAFLTPSTALGDLTNPTATAVLLVLVFLLRLLKSVLLPYFSSIGRRAGRRTHGVEWEKANEERIVKFGEYVFRLLFHSAISAYGVWYFWDKAWWDSAQGGTKNLYVGFPDQQPVEVGMIWYYLVQGAYNVEAFLSLLELSVRIRVQSPMYRTSGKDGKSEAAFRSPVTVGWASTVRGDFREMVIHHVVTNLLIIGSSHFRLTRVGSMVFLVHDLSDVPVDVSKLANFLKWKVATVCGFASMVLTWLATRLTVFPFVIYRSVLFESYMLVSHEGIDPIYYYAYRPFFFTLIGLILLLHVAWFGMFLRMGYLLIRKNETHDLSEHKGGEDQLKKENGVANVAAPQDVRNTAENGDSVNGTVATGAANGKKEN